MESLPDVSIVSHFKDLPDPRIERAKKHYRLIDIIVVALGVFARLHPKRFHQYFLSWTRAVSKFT